MSVERGVAPAGGVGEHAPPLLLGHQALQVFPPLPQLLAHNLVPPHLRPQLLEEGTRPVADGHTRRPIRVTGFQNLFKVQPNKGIVTKTRHLALDFGM